MSLAATDSNTDIAIVQHMAYNVAQNGYAMQILRLMAEIETFGDWMRVMRKERRLTQAQLAEAAGLARTYIVSIEKGRVKLPQDTNRRKLHKVFGTDDSVLEDLGLLAWDGFGNEYIPDREAPMVVEVITDQGTQTLIAERMDAPTSLKRLIDAVEWTPDREIEISEKLWEFAREDARNRSQ